MELLPYNESYKSQVIDCLQRNFDWMGESSFSDVEEWMEPVFNHTWNQSTSVTTEEYPYTKGAVVVEAEKVVGYLGMIVSRRGTGENSYIFASPTTWALDEEYRFYLPQISRGIFKDGICYADYTSRKSVELVLRKFFKFDKCPSRQYRLLPIPCYDDKLTVNIIDDIGLIDDIIVKKMFDDHKQFYGIYLSRFEDVNTGNNGYVFIKKYDEDSKRLRVLKIINNAIFAENAHEIIWKVYSNVFFNGKKSDEILVDIIDDMYERKKVCIECDEMMLCGNRLNYPNVKSKEMVRLWRGDNLAADKDFMYTEMAILNNRLQ